MAIMGHGAHASEREARERGHDEEPNHIGACRPKSAHQPLQERECLRLRKSLRGRRRNRRGVIRSRLDARDGDQGVNFQWH